MEISKPTHLMVDVAGALAIGAGLLLTLRYFGANVYIGNFNPWSYFARTIEGAPQGIAAQPADATGMDASFVDETGSGEATAWAVTDLSQSDTYWGYNYLPPNQVAAGILPNPLAPASTQTIPGAAGQATVSAVCNDCGG